MCKTEMSSDVHTEEFCNPAKKMEGGIDEK